MILILSNEDASLATMMLGYLDFYGKGRVTCRAAEPGSHIHPLAQQVMQEDGIDISKIIHLGLSEITAGDYKIILSINHASDKYQRFFNHTQSIREVSFSSPLALTRYEDVLEAFRAVREQIKKVSIELMGNVLTVLP